MQKTILLNTIVAVLVNSAIGNATVLTNVSGPIVGSGTLIGVINTTSGANDNVAGLSPNTINMTESITGFDPNSGFLSNFTMVASPNGRTEYTVTKTITPPTCCYRHSVRLSTSVSYIARPCRRNRSYTDQNHSRCVLLFELYHARRFRQHSPGTQRYHRHQ